MHEAVQTLVRIEPAAIGFGCTSGSFVGGLAFERGIRERMEASGARVAVTPMSGLVDALHALGARRVGIGHAVRRGRSRRRWRTTSPKPGSSRSRWRTSRSTTRKRSSPRPTTSSSSSPDARCGPAPTPIFLSCTNLPTFAILGDVEREIGVPVLSANQTLMWGLCQAAGIPLGGATNSLTSLQPALIAS